MFLLLCAFLRFYGYFQRFCVKMLTSPNGIRGNTTKLKGGMFYGNILRKFARVLSLSSYILGNASKSTGI